MIFPVSGILVGAHATEGPCWGHVVQAVTWGFQAKASDVYGGWQGDLHTKSLDTNTEEDIWAVFGVAEHCQVLWSEKYSTLGQISDSSSSLKCIFISNWSSLPSSKPASQFSSSKSSFLSFLTYYLVSHTFNFNSFNDTLIDLNLLKRSRVVISSTKIIISLIIIFFFLLGLSLNFINWGAYFTNFLFRLS